MLRDQHLFPLRYCFLQGRLIHPLRVVLDVRLGVMSHQVCRGENVRATTALVSPDRVGVSQAVGGEALRLLPE